MIARTNGREKVVEALVSNDTNRLCTDMNGDWVFYCQDLGNGFVYADYSWYPCSVMDAEGSPGNPHFPLGACTYVGCRPYMDGPLDAGRDPLI